MNSLYALYQLSQASVNFGKNYVKSVEKNSETITRLFLMANLGIITTKALYYENSLSALSNKILFLGSLAGGCVDYVFFNPPKKDNKLPDDNTTLRASNNTHEDVSITYRYAKPPIQKVSRLIIVAQLIQILGSLYFTNNKVISTIELVGVLGTLHKINLLQSRWIEITASIGFSNLGRHKAKCVFYTYLSPLEKIDDDMLCGIELEKPDSYCCPSQHPFIGKALLKWYGEKLERLIRHHIPRLLPTIPVDTSLHHTTDTLIFDESFGLAGQYIELIYRSFLSQDLLPNCPTCRETSPNYFYVVHGDLIDIDNTFKAFFKDIFSVITSCNYPFASAYFYNIVDFVCTNAQFALGLAQMNNPVAATTMFVHEPMMALGFIRQISQIEETIANSLNPNDAMQYKKKFKPVVSLGRNVRDIGYYPIGYYPIERVVNYLMDQISFEGLLREKTTHNTVLAVYEQKGVFLATKMPKTIKIAFALTILSTISIFYFHATRPNLQNTFLENSLSPEKLAKFQISLSPPLGYQFLQCFQVSKVFFSIAHAYSLKIIEDQKQMPQTKKIFSYQWLKNHGKIISNILWNYKATLINILAVYLFSQMKWINVYKISSKSIPEYQFYHQSFSSKFTFFIPNEIAKSNQKFSAFLLKIHEFTDNFFDGASWEAFFYDERLSFTAYIKPFDLNFNGVDFSKILYGFPGGHANLWSGEYGSITCKY